MAGPKPCSTGPLPAGRSYGGRQAFDLRAGGCSVLTNEADLEGAVLTVTVAADPIASRGLDIYAKDLRLELNQSTALATSVGAADAPWSATAAGALAPGGGAAVASQEPLPNPPGFNPSLRLADPAGETSSFTLRDMTFAQPLDPTAEVTSLEVVMRSPTGAENYLSDPVDGSSIDFRVDGDGWSCSTSDTQLTRSHSQSNQELRYDLFSGGDCLPVVSDGASLDGADLTVTLRTGCTQSPYLLFGTKCTSVTLPEFDVVGLVATTNTVSSAPYSEVTIDVALGADGQPADVPGSSSFDTFGPVVLPSADLDIHWLGGTFNRPLFGGRLQVGGLGSDMNQDGGTDAEMGVVCCTPLEGAGVLEARIGSVIRAEAIVRTDDANPGRVDILDWKLCGRGGC